MYVNSPLTLCSSLEGDEHTIKPHHESISFDSNHYVALIGLKQSNDICILKCIHFHANEGELMDRFCHQIHELFVFNQMIRALGSNYLPILPQIIGYGCNQQIADPALKKDAFVPLIETIFPHMSVASWIQSNSYSETFALTLLTHILLSLMVLNQTNGFVHHDLRLSKILLQPMESFYPKWKNHPTIVGGS